MSVCVCVCVCVYVNLLRGSPPAGILVAMHCTLQLLILLCGVVTGVMWSTEGLVNAIILL